MKTITAYKKEDFRKWLAKNHESESRVIVIVYKKHTGKPTPTHRELIEEAISFGWIDTTIRRIDEDKFARTFCKRTKNSRWSDNTLKYAKQIIKEGRMSEQGLKFYKLGLAKPTHDHEIPKNPSMPAEIKTALSKNKKAEKNFNSFPPSAKKMIYRWYLRAKLSKTREQRIKKIVKDALENTISH
jgi:uncharacterized protein YdeI (YjbR/CyaY-like superfamily)